MIQQPKLRIIAGPNGSGKSTFINDVIKNEYFYLHNYINADDIQKELDGSNAYTLNRFSFKTSKADFDKFIAASSFKEKIEDKIEDILFFENNIISIQENKSNSYIAALIADFLRNQLLLNGLSFEFETVMSHESKIDFLKAAKEKGYKIYLYFLCTESPQINKLNVSNRVKQGGHFVQEDVIEKRYYKTLSLLKDAIDNAEVSYILQNNLTDFSSIYVIKSGEIIEQNAAFPIWFQHYYLDKLTK